MVVDKCITQFRFKIDIIILIMVVIDHCTVLKQSACVTISSCNYHSLFLGSVFYGKYINFHSEHELREAVLSKDDYKYYS